MKKTKKLWTASVALAAFTAFGFVAEPTPSLAQISFGRMRDASEKGPKPSAPIVDEDEEADAFDVAPNGDQAKDGKPETPRSTRTIGRRSNAAGGNSARTTPRTPAARPAAPAPQNGAKTAAQPSSGAARQAETAANETASEETSKPETAANATSTAKPARNPLASASTPNASAATLDDFLADETEANGETDVADSTDATPDDGERGPRFGKAISTKYRAGMIFEARANGGCKDLLGTAPVPTEFPEQKVRTLEENFPRSARVDYRDLKEGGARQMVFRMRELKPGQRVEATVLFEVTRRPLLPPSQPEIYRFPKTVPRDLRRYLKAGDYIESTSKTVRKLASDIIEQVEEANKDATDWEKIDALFEYVRTEISYKEAQVEKPMRGALAALRTRDGDCEDMSALFIAMCRSLDVPARLVRVPGHCWAEFYLVDDEKNGYWFPAQVAGTEELGSMQDVRVILQKGDSFRLPESPKEDSLYVKELFTGQLKENAPDPIYQFIQDTNPTD
ncbi:MAG: transglutaminase domain-containing protein [Thermoguttaceae bacterium]|nr:transglutaminase domain-containing protein [Thermoguttaceae bacterium]